MGGNVSCFLATHSLETTCKTFSVVVAIAVAVVVVIVVAVVVVITLQLFYNGKHLMQK
jgi:hypothetical protein